MDKVSNLATVVGAVDKLQQAKVKLGNLPANDLPCNIRARLQAALDNLAHADVDLIYVQNYMRERLRSSDA